MYKSTLKETPKTLSLNIPWDSNTARGFAAALVIMTVIWLVTPFFDLGESGVGKVKPNTVPIELLNLGSGDGTGLKSGNLTKEGAASNGKKPKMNIEDAKKAAKSSNKNVSDLDPEETSKLIASNDSPSNNDNNTKISGVDKETIGKESGTNLTGSGLRNKGTGRGAGDGFGDIDWGGGGNRIVLSKKLPRFPKSVKANAQIKLRIKVLPDGTVSQVIPLQKADPALENAAIAAVKQWRFNPLTGEDKKVMWGTIPLTFILR